MDARGQGDKWGQIACCEIHRKSIKVKKKKKKKKVELNGSAYLLLSKDFVFSLDLKQIMRPLSGAYP